MANNHATISVVRYFVKSKSFSLMKLLHLLGRHINDDINMYKTLAITIDYKTNTAYHNRLRATLSLSVTTVGTTEGECVLTASIRRRALTANGVWQASTDHR